MISPFITPVLFSGGRLYGNSYRGRSPFFSEPPLKEIQFTKKPGLLLQIFQKITGFNLVNPYVTTFEQAQDLLDSAKFMASIPLFKRIQKSTSGEVSFKAMDSCVIITPVDQQREGEAHYRIEGMRDAVNLNEALKKWYRPPKFKSKERIQFSVTSKFSNPELFLRQESEKLWVA